MTLQNRTVLKSYLEEGDYPTQEQFEELIDSMFNKIEDDAIIGLKGHKTTVPYKAGTGVLYGGGLYMALVDNQGTFDVAKWQLVTSPAGVLEFNAVVDFPAVGVGATIYIDLSTGFGYRWNGGGYTLLFKLDFNSDELIEGDTNRFYTPARSAENEKVTNKGVAGGYAGLDGGGKVPASQLPSYVDDVLEFADYASLPVTGEAGKIYVLDTPHTSGGYTSSQFRWSGTVYIPIVETPGTSDALAEGATNKYFTVARVLAVALTGYVLGAATAILASDTILQAFGKIEARLNANASAIATNTTATNANATSLLTKLTQGGDSPASTLRAGTNNAQSFAIRTNGVDRLVTDAIGNTVQQGSTTLFDIVKLRIRDFGGTFKEVFSSSVTNVLTFASGWVEIDFSGAWTQLKGTNSRMVEVNSAGVQSAVEEIIPFFIYNPAVQSLLSNSANWSKANVYTGTSLSTYLLDQGQFYRDSLYEYTMYSTTEVVRKPLYRVARRLYNDYEVKNNVGATATTVYTYTIPANTLNKNGDALEIKFNCQFVNSSSFMFKINATITGGGGGGVGYYYGSANYKILRNSGGSQTLFTSNLNTTGMGINTYSEITNFDETADIIITVELQGASTNDVYANLFEVDFKPSV